VKRFENEGSPIAEEMPCRTAALYGIEKTVRGRDPAVRLAARGEHSGPIVAAPKPWLEARLSRIPQKSRLAEDLRYTLAHWPGLIVRQASPSTTAPSNSTPTRSRTGSGRSR
jgi:hypothetical protein